MEKYRAGKATKVSVYTSNRNSTYPTFLNLGRWIRTKSAVLANPFYTALSFTVKPLQEGYNEIYGFVSRTYRYLEAARKYERRVQKTRHSISYITRSIGQSPRNRAKGLSQPGSIDTSLEVLP